MNLYQGVVENRKDPLKLGRCQVRVVGLHTHDKTVLKTEDLPWAYPMQPVTSAGVSGIGHAPVGPVEGSWVIVMFRDEDQQYPVILGTVGGIPQEFGGVDNDPDTILLKLPDQNAVVSTNVLSDNSGAAQSVIESTPIPSTGLKPARDYSVIGTRGIALIKQYEGLKLKAYKDSVGIWTIGYGTTVINGSPVYEGQTITEAQALDYLNIHLTANVIPIIHSKTKALITQSMFDAACCFTYNVGSGAYSKSTLVQELNASKYLEAAGHFLDFNKGTVDGVKIEIDGLTRRRTSEKNLFLADGIPNVSGDVTPVTSDQPSVDSNVPATSIQSSGMDSQTRAAMVLGFKDPKGKYPLYLNEPDTNKLARHEDIDKTIVYKKEVAREKGVVTAGGVTWNQSPIPYNSLYPFNHVFQSESGHILEFDDTPNSERTQLYHKSGTYTETDSNGTQVNRIVGDKYEILERNGYVYIKGAANVTIDGDHNVKINNALNVEVSGKAIINVYNDADINVSGSMDLNVKETLNIKAATINMEAATIGVKATTLNETATTMNVNSSTYLETVGTSYYRWNGAKYTWLGGDSFSRHSSGTDYECPSDPTRDSDSACPTVTTAGSASATGLGIPTDKQTPEVPVFADLIVITRGLQAASNYETPDDGDPTEYIAKRIENGTLSSDEKDSGTETDSSTNPNSTKEAGAAKCDMIYGMDSFSSGLQLSPHFTLGRLTSDGTRMPVTQQGLSAQEIVCNLKGLAENCLEPIIDRYPGIMITSGFRRPGDVANSSKTSQHYLGQAADIVIPGFNREQHYEAIKIIQQMVPYDQLLLEYSGSSTVWIHVSFKYTGNRKQSFTMRDHHRVGEFGQYKLIV